MNVERVLIAGIGNIFWGDDGFGCEVARRLAQRPLRPGVRVRDFGIRAYDLAFALMDPWELVILVDATQRGGQPGTLYVVEPDLANLNVDGAPVALQTHSLDPVQALRLVQAFGGTTADLLLVGCEPAELGDADDGQMGLSPAVAEAVERAPALVDDLVERHFAGAAAGRGGAIGRA